MHNQLSKSNIATERSVKMFKTDKQFHLLTDANCFADRIGILPKGTPLLSFLELNSQESCHIQVQNFDSAQQNTFTCTIKNITCVFSVLFNETEDLWEWAIIDQFEPFAVNQVSSDLVEAEKIEELFIAKQELDQILANVSEIVFKFDNEGTLIYVSPEVSRTYGYVVSEMIGTNFLSYVYPADLQIAVDALKEIVVSHKPAHNILCRAVAKDGSIRWLSTSANYIFDKDGRPAYGVALAKDITANYEALQQLKASEQRYTTFLKNTTEAIWRIEIPGGIDIELTPEEQVQQIWEKAYIAESNDAYAKVYSYADALQLQGKKIQDFISSIEEINKESYIEFIKSRYKLSDTATVETDRFGNKKYLLNNRIGIIEDGKLVRIWGTLRDITEQRHAQLALKESEERYRLFIKQSTEAIWRGDFTEPIDTSLPAEEQVKLMFERGYLAECNDQMATILGFTVAADLYGAKMNDFVPIDHEFTQIASLMFVRNGYRMFKGPSVQTTKDGIKKYFLNNLIGIIEDGFLTRIWGIQTDVTEQRLAEKALKDSEERYRAFIKHSSEGIWRIEGVPYPLSQFNEDGLIDFIFEHATVIECNDAFAKMYGYEKAEEMNGVRLDAILPKSDPFNIEYLRSFIRNGFRLENVESHEIDRFGNPIYMMNSLVGIVQNDRLVRVWGTQKDITKLKIAEKELTNRELQYRALAESVPVLIHRLNRKFQFTYVNSAVKHTFNVQPDQFIGRDPKELGLRDELWKVLRSKGQRVFETAKAESFTFTIPSASRPGSYYNLLINVSPEIDETGFVHSIIAIASDISELAKAQDELLYKDKLLSFLSDTANQFLKEENFEIILPSVLNHLGTVISADRVYIFKHEGDHANIYSTWFNDSVSPIGNASIMSTLDYASYGNLKLAFKENVGYDFEKGKANSEGWNKLMQVQHVMSGIVAPIFSDQSFWGVVVVDSCTNIRSWNTVEKDFLKAFASTMSSAITRRMSIQQISEGESRFRLMADNAPVMLWVSDVDDEIVYINQPFSVFTGYTLEELRTKRWESLVHPDDKNIALLPYSEHFKKREPVTLEYRLRNKDGEYRWVLDESIPRTLSDGTFHGFMGSLIDINDRKINEEKIRYQARVIQEVSEAIISVDLKFMVTSWNRGAEMIYGIPADQILGKYLGEKVVYTFIGDTFEDSINHMTKYGYWSGEVFFTRADGKKVYLHSSVTFLTDEKGKHIGYVANNRDITERRKSEEALRISEERYRTVVNALGEGIILNDANGDVIAVNASACEITGFNEADLKSKRNIGPDFQPIHEDGSPFPMEQHPFNITLQTGKSVQGVIMGIRKPDGSLNWITVNTEPIYYSEQRVKPDAVVASFVDITERKTAEIELQRNEKQLREYSERINDILNSITDGFIAVDNQMTVFLWNKEFEKYTGVRTVDAIGKPVKAIFPGLDLATLNMFDQALKQRKTLVQESFNAPFGIWFEITAYPSTQGLFIYFRDISSRKRQEFLLALEKQVLELNARPHASLKVTVDYLLIGLERVMPGIHCSVLGLEDDSQTLYTISAPSIPEAYCKAIEGLKIGPREGSCGAALYRKENVIVSDITTHEYWEKYKDIALQFGLRACWSYPIISAQNQAIASFALYHEQVTYPSVEEMPIIERMVNILRVIIESKQFEERIKISNERYLLATMATNDAIWDSDLIGKTIYWGEGFHTLFGYKAGYFTDTNQVYEQYIHPQDRARVVEGLNKFIASSSQQVWQEEYRFKRADGKYVLVSDRGFLIYNQQGKVSRMVGSMQDITEKRELEKKLLKQELNRQKLVAQAVVDAQEKERSLIGKELHDNVNQILSTAKLYLEVAKNEEQEKNTYIDMSVSNISNAINEIRTISRSLVPASIGDLGLVESIQDLVESIKLARKFEVEFAFDADIDNLISEQQKLMLFRITQEQINNVIKHANAKHLYIKLGVEAGNISLQIIDDGQGFDPEKLKSKKGVGLSNIASRAELFNGKMHIISAPTQGCTLKIDVPILNL